MDNARINTDNTLVGEPEEFLKCEICDEKIKGEAITNKETEGFATSDEVYREKTIISVFCSEECEYIHNILHPMHRPMGNLTRIINHLIKDHGYKVKILEKVLNSKKFKELWDGEPY